MSFPELKVQIHCFMNHTQVNAPPQVLSAAHTVWKRGILFPLSLIQQSSPLGWWHFVKCAQLKKRRLEQKCFQHKKGSLAGNTGNCEWHIVSGMGLKELFETFGACYFL